MAWFHKDTKEMRTSIKTWVPNWEWIAKKLNVRRAKVRAGAGLLRWQRLIKHQAAKHRGLHEYHTWSKPGAQWWMGRAEWISVDPPGNKQNPAKWEQARQLIQSLLYSKGVTTITCAYKRLKSSHGSGKLYSAKKEKDSSVFWLEVC